MTQAQERKINNDESLNIVHKPAYVQTAWGNLPGWIFLYLAKDTLKKSVTFGRNWKLSISRLYRVCKLLVNFQSLAQLYLQVLCIASFSQSAALTRNLITQEHKITVPLILEHE